MYVDLYKTMNDLKEPLQLVKLCKTRWLVWFPAVKKILEQWIELKALFRMAACDKDYKARQLDLMYQDQTNLLYLTFLKPVLSEINEVNLLFQATKADITKLYKDLRTLIFSLARRVLSPQAVKETTNLDVLRDCEVEMLLQALDKPENLLPYDRVDLGSSFNTLASSPNLDCSSERIYTVREKCTKFLLTLIRELLNRMPQNVTIIQKLRFLAPDLVMTPVGRPRFDQLPLDLLDSGSDLDSIEGQWRSLGTLRLDDISSDFQNLTKIDSVKFLGKVKMLTNAGGAFPYNELATFALKCLTLPVSNAVVERVFSIMNSVKTRPRNRMQLDLLQSIIRIRVHIKQVLKCCCKNYQPTDDMLKLFTNQMYESTKEEKKAQTESAEPDDAFEENLIEVVRLLADDGLDEDVPCSSTDSQ